MLDAISERLIARLLGIGAAFTTILVVSGSVTDPVNTPKFTSIGVISTVVFGLIVFTNLRTNLRSNKLFLGILFLFVLQMVVSVIMSESPFSQNFYGSYGRNNGLLTYLFLSWILLAALTLRGPSNFEILIKGLLFAGLVNVVYCLWVLTFGDFVSWSNPYGNILGTLGNPNFIGSFLGIFFTCYLAYAIKPRASRIYRYSVPLVLPITAFEIYESNAIQGRVVAALGLGILGFLLIRARFGQLITIAYSITCVSIGVVSVLGALQIGPLTQVIYKTSVSLRGQYWLAGWNTGESNPFTGVGMDAFGDWYRRSRDLHALELPGVNTVVNAAHNVPLDMFAFGGWPLLFTYLLIMGFSATAIIKMIRRHKEFDGTLAVLVVGWGGYQLQSIISINQIGLAVWGWVLSGAVLAYERATRDEVMGDAREQLRQSKIVRSQSVQPKLILVSSVSALIGLLVALPPLSSDAKWRGAQLVRSVPALEASMQASYFNPQNSNKFINNIQILESSGLFELSHKYALQAVDWNSEDFYLWKILYLISASTPEEKSKAISNMKRLDPLNPDVTSTK